MPDLQVVANAVGSDWKRADYYDKAERFFERQWNGRVWPFLASNPIDWSVTIDLAAGHGRNTAKLLELAYRLLVVDINKENIEFCRTRFGDSVEYHLTDGFSLPFVRDEEATFIYCFDAMVHFDSDVVRAYLKEFKRVLDPKRGYAFLHHSNYTANPGGNHRKNPAWRNFMSKELMAHYAIKEGLGVVAQKTIDWAWNGRELDCFTLLCAGPLTPPR